MDRGLVAAADAELGPPFEKFGRYWLVDRIATGGMAEVYRAVSRGVEGFRRTFIIKRILTEKANSPDFRRMFCDEARISALLHHPNIAQVYDFGHVSGSYFLAMEYLPGKDLASVMRVLRASKAAVPPGLAAYIAREAALGLHYAHTLCGPNGEELRIVHRDVTPSNIMLLFEGGVKLLDFGIAKSAQAAEDSHLLKGKYAYLAPEQARREEVDRRADVFTLGVTLWEMLVGRRLFAGKDDNETLHNVLNKPVAPPSIMRPRLPAALDRIVLRALQRDREKRYATAEELAFECDAVLDTLRADSQTLRAFLKDLFVTESTSVALALPALPALPEEPADAAVAQGDDGSPASPAIASTAVTPTVSLWPPLRRRSLGGGALIAGVLIALGFARHGARHPTTPLRASSAAASERAVTRPFVVLLPSTEPTATPPSGRNTGSSPAKDGLPGAQPSATAPSDSQTESSLAKAERPGAEPNATAPSDSDAESSPAKDERHGHTHHRATLRKLPSDMTLDPF